MYSSVEIYEVKDISTKIQILFEQRIDIIIVSNCKVSP